MYLPVSTLENSQGGDTAPISGKLLQIRHQRFQKIKKSPGQAGVSHLLEAFVSVRANFSHLLGAF